jgi:hypothetical protein
MTPTATDPLSIDIPGSDFMTEKETARLFKCSPRTVASWRTSGKLPHLRMGRRVVYLRRDVIAFANTVYVRKEASRVA